MTDSAAAGRAASAPAPRLTRDRVTWMLYLHMAAFGYFLYCFGPSVSLLGDDLGVGNAVAGLHSTAYAAAGLMVGVAGAGPVRRFGRGPALWGGCALLAAGVVLYCAATVLAVTLAAALLCGLGAFLIVNLAGAALTDHHGPKAGPGALSEANGMAAAVGMVAPLAIGAADASGAGWRTGMLVTPVLFLLLALVLGRTPVPDVAATTAGPDGRDGRDGQDDPLPRAYWWAWVLTVTCVASEFSLSLWSSELLRDRTGLSEGAAAGAMTAVVAGLCAGRFGGGRLVLWLSPTRLHLAALAVNLAGFAVFWTSTDAVLSVAGLFVAGLGMSVQFPLSMARAIAGAGGRADLAVSRLAPATTLAAGGAPFALGLAADHLGVRTAFALVPLFIAASVPALLLSARAGRADAEP